MKTFSASKSPETRGHDVAVGYAASNAVLPGLGTLAAGRKIGLAQLALCLVGFGLTLACGTHFIYWTLAHWSDFQKLDPNADPLDNLRQLWQQSRWPLLGILLFAVSWLWALITSRALLATSKNKPPVLGKTQYETK